MHPSLIDTFEFPDVAGELAGIQGCCVAAMVTPHLSPSRRWYCAVHCNPICTDWVEPSLICASNRHTPRDNTRVFRLKRYWPDVGSNRNWLPGFAAPTPSIVGGRAGGEPESCSTVSVIVAVPVGVPAAVRS